VIASTIENMEARGIWQAYGLVVMPDHIHMVVRLSKGPLSDAVKSFSTFTSGRINRLLNRKGPLWQAGFYDHALRGEKALGAYLEYMLMNPVRAGLVESPQDWAYSVFNVRPRPLSTLPIETSRRQEAAPTTTVGGNP
jgi:putative transposase